MLIKIQDIVSRHHPTINGILHIGAHECEEWADYQSVGLAKNNVIWIDALDEKVSLMKGADHRIFQLVAHDKDGESVKFNITNNYQSSSVLNLQEHLIEHPHIHVIEKRWLVTSRIDTFYKDHAIPANFANFVNLDIQGNELRALIGMGDILDNIDYIYTEINTKYLYANCCLLGELDSFLSAKGFIRLDTTMTSHGWGDAFYKRL